ncbi:MAG: hypothetical protein ACI4SA_02225, partial [Lachnospiraceae bacterium]
DSFSCIPCLHCIYGIYISDADMVYITKGINRRKQDEVFSEIFDSYIKILQVNLDSGDFDIIKMDIGEKEEACGFSRNIKEWLHHFAQCGMVQLSGCITGDRSGMPIVM